MVEERKYAIGWDEQDDLENDDKLAAENVSEDNYVGCCQTTFHTIDTAEEFQALLKALNAGAE